MNINPKKPVQLSISPLCIDVLLLLWGLFLANHPQWPKYFSELEPIYTSNNEQTSQPKLPRHYLCWLYGASNGLYFIVIIICTIIFNYITNIFVFAIFIKFGFPCFIVHFTFVSDTLGYICYLADTPPTTHCGCGIDLPFRVSMRGVLSIDSKRFGLDLDNCF